MTSASRTPLSAERASSRAAHDDDERDPRDILDPFSEDAIEGGEGSDVSRVERAAPARVEVRGLGATFDHRPALVGVDIEIRRNEVLAVIGPSSSGKSTLLRCLNRMHELTPGARVTGEVRLDGTDIYAKGVDPARVRRRMGLLVQRPNPFPTMSIRDNVLAGLRLTGTRVDQPAEAIERHLRDAGLWREVKDKLGVPSGSLSIGQQQRLCVARLLAVEPEVVLLDEPCALLDPVATARMEELMIELKDRFALVLVTHNMQQAARVSDRTAFFHEGSLVEVGPTGRIFTNPRETRTEDYVTGRFG